MLSIDLAEKVSRSDDFGLRHIRFDERQVSELRFASLLHDFGKIGVREETLLKAEKLYPQQRERIDNRLDRFVAQEEIRLLRALLGPKARRGRGPLDSQEVEVLETQGSPSSGSASTDTARRSRS